MIRCVRIWTAEDGNSRFEEGVIDMPKGERGDVLSGVSPVTGASFRPTYGIDLSRDADACRKVRAKTAETLCVDNI